METLQTMETRETIETMETTGNPIAYPTCFVTSWLSYDIPTGDNGTGDHELNMIYNFCGDRNPEILEVREKNSHLPYYVRNLVFHQGDRNKFYLGPSPHYGLRLVKKHFFIY